MNKTKFQAGFQSQFGDAGPPVQYSDTITITELKELIKENKIRPDQLFLKEEILNDPKVKDYIELERQKAEKIEADKLKEEDSLIPDDKPGTLTAEQKKQQEEYNKFIPDSDKPGDSDSDLIPD